MKVKIGNNYSETEYIFLYSLDSVLGSLFFIFINDLPYDIKSETKLFADDGNLLVRPLSK